MATLQPKSPPAQDAECVTISVPNAVAIELINLQKAGTVHAAETAKARAQARMGWAVAIVSALATIIAALIQAFAGK